MYIKKKNIFNDSRNNLKVTKYYYMSGAVQPSQLSTVVSVFSISIYKERN